MTENYDISTQPANSFLRDFKSLIEIVVPLVRQLKTPSPLSIGLSDLPIGTFSQHSPPLRFGLCWYRVGLSALNYRINQSAPKERFDSSIVRQGYDFDSSIVRQGYDFDTSIVRQGYDFDYDFDTRVAYEYNHRHTVFQGLKDRRIFIKPGK